MRPCGLKLSAMNKRWLPILGMLVFSVSLHGQGSVVVFDEQQRFDVVDRYEPDGDTVSLWLSVPLSAYDGPFASLSRYRFRSSVMRGAVMRGIAAAVAERDRSGQSGYRRAVLECANGRSPGSRPAG